MVICKNKNPEIFTYIYIYIYVCKYFSHCFYTHAQFTYLPLLINKAVRRAAFMAPLVRINVSTSAGTRVRTHTHTHPHTHAHTHTHTRVRECIHPSVVHAYVCRHHRLMPMTWRIRLYIRIRIYTCYTRDFIT